MTEVVDKPPRRRLLALLLITATLVVLALIGLIWYTTTDSFQALLRRHVIAQLEKITGGKVELGGFHSIPLRFVVDIRDLTIHGRENSKEVPYVHVDRLVAQVRIISALGAQLAFDSLEVEHPVFHFIVYPDGTTNQPQPKMGAASGQSGVEKLFSLSVGRLEVQHGELLWENQRIPLDLSARDVSASVSYSHFRRRFESSVILGKVDTKFKDFRPFAWRAEAHFDLRSNYVEVSSLKWLSGNSSLEFKGRLADFRRPKAEGTYNGTVDLGEFSAIARRREIRSGLVDLQGKGSWSSEQFATDGKLQLHNFDWQDDNLSLRNVSLSSDFSVTDQQLRLSKIEGRLLEGIATGDLEVTNWLNPPDMKNLARGPQAKRETKAMRAAEQQGAVHLRFKGISVPALATALTTPARPLNRVTLAGVANASVDESWKGSLRNAETQIALEIIPPARPSSPELPVTASARVTYRAQPQELEVSEFTASTPASQLRLSGKLSSVSSLRISASSADLGEWKPILSALRGPAELAVSLHGRANFSGIATGKLSALSFAGTLQVNDFESPVATSLQLPEKQMHWDSLTANLQFSPDHFAAHNATLRHGQMVVHFDVSTSLQQRQFTDDSVFVAHAEVHDGELAELENLLGYDYPVTGRLDLQLQAAGTRADPHGDGQVTITDGIVYGQPVARFTSDIRLANGEAQLNNIQAAQYNAAVTGSAAYNLSDKSLHFNLTGTNFELSRIDKFQTPRFNVEGRVDFTAQGSGSLEQPVINAKIDLRDLIFDQERAGDFTINAVTQGSDLRLTGRSQFPGSDLQIDGTVGLRGDWPAVLTLHFHHLDVDSLIRAYFRGRVTGHSAMAGDLRFTGPLCRPSELNITGNLNEFLINVEDIKLRNEGSIQFGLAGQTFHMDRLHLVGDLTDFTAHGKAQLGAERQLDFQADGRVDLRLIESFNPDFTSSGTITAGLTVGGTMADPVVEGQIEIRDGNISYASLPSGLSNMNGSLIFNRDRLQIQTLTARTGGGLVNVGGSVTYYRGLASFDLTAQGQDVRLRYPPGVSATANADVRLTGTSAAAILAGDVTITKLAVTPGFDFASYLESTKQSIAVPNPNSLTNRLKLDVHIATTPELQMQTALAKLSGDADLHLRGTAARPVLLGRVDILEGEVSFNGAKYRLERGDVLFTNPVHMEPQLDLQATTRVSDYDITVGLSGTPDKLRANWRSEPPLPEADILSLLALGRTREQSAALQGSSTFNQQASNMILSEAFNSMVSSRAQNLFGVSRIRIDPQGPGTETSLVSSAPQVTIEQQVVNNLILTYSTNVSQTSQQIIQMEYNLTRNISIVALRDYNGVVSFSVRVRRHRK